MKLLLIAIACALTGCSLDTVDDTPILLRHRGGDRVDADAGVIGPDAGIAGQFGIAGAAGSGSLGGAGQGGASGAGGAPQGGSPSAGSGGANAGSAGLASTAGAAGASGSAGLAGSAGYPAGGAPGGQGGAAGSQEAGAAGVAGVAGVAGSPIDYFKACGNAQGDPGAPLWQTDWNGGGTPSSEYLSGIPERGQVQSNCGVFYDLGKDQYDRCVWICSDMALCRQYPPDGSVHTTLNNSNAWRAYCDCWATDSTRCCQGPGDSNCALLPGPG